MPSDFPTDLTTATPLALVGPVIDAHSAAINDIEDDAATVDARLDAIEQMAINSQAGTSYTLALADAGKLVETTNAAAVTVTVPPNSSVAFPLGTVIYFLQYGAGQITFVGGSGVSLRSLEGATRTADRYAKAVLWKRGADEWVLEGELTAGVPAPVDPSWTSVLYTDFPDDGVLPAPWLAYNFEGSVPGAAYPNYWIPSHVIVAGGICTLRQSYEATGPAVGVSGYEGDGGGWYQGAIAAAAFGPWLTVDYRITTRIRVVSTGGIGSHRNLPLLWPQIRSTIYSSNGEQDVFESDSALTPPVSTYLHYAASGGFVQITWPALDLTQWHTYRFEKKGYRLRIYVDNLANPIIDRPLTAYELPDHIVRAVFQQENPNFTPPAGTTGSEDIQIDWIQIEVPSSVTTLDDATTGAAVNQFEYSGTWTVEAAPGFQDGYGAYLSSQRHNAVTGSYYQVRFVGNQARIYTTVGPDCGIMGVSVDGGTETNVDLYDAQTRYMVHVYSTPLQASGQHTLKVRVTGTKHASSSGYRVIADRVDVDTAPVAPPTVASVNDSAVGVATNQFEFVGTWIQGTDTGAFGDDEHYSAITNAYYQVRFYGTQIKIYSTLDPAHGIFEASIDGGAISYHDLYDTARSQQQLVYTSSVLALGLHTLKVNVSGAKNASSTGYTIVADRVDITA